jgi:hypothetical protein
MSTGLPVQVFRSKTSKTVFGPVHFCLYLELDKYKFKNLNQIFVSRIEKNIHESCSYYIPHVQMHMNNNMGYMNKD